MGHDSGRHLSEEEIIRLAGRLAGGVGPGLAMGIGDDCAVLELAGGALVVTTDMLVEGKHFRLDWDTPRSLARRSLAANLSDLAAMGAVPRWGFLSLGLPAPAQADFVEDLLGSLVEAGREVGLVLAGGDTVAAPQVIINLCLMGAMEGVQPALRSGAQVGQAVCVTGVLGDSGAGLAWLLMKGDRSDPAVAPLLAAHLEPQPRLKAGRVLAASGLLGAMMDISDGLASDLARMALASSQGAMVGARVEAGLLPISDASRALAARLGVDALDWALRGGEDYELLFTCAPEHVAALTVLVAQAEPGLSVTRVGEMVAGAGLRLGLPDGSSREIGLTGFDHFRKD
jgi:thiamine-monophosphate kinase